MVMEVKRTHWAFLFFLLTLSGCGGGGGGSSATQVPAVSNLLVEPGETGKITLSFDFADQGADVETVTVVLYDGKGSILGASTNSISNVAGYRSGNVRGTESFPDLTAGDYSFELFITDRGGRESNRLSKRFAATGGFGEAATYTSDNLDLGATAIGDLNGDGRKDVAAIQGSFNLQKLLVYYQNESRTLNAPISSTLSIEPSGVAVGDVNNDGKADLILSGRTTDIRSSGQFIVFLQDPWTGRLLPTQEYFVSSSYVSSLDVADLNGDGRNDVVVMSPAEDGSGSLSIFFQNSAGTFNAELKYQNTEVNGKQVHVADMDNDGINDIVVQSAYKEFAVIRQTAPGIFSPFPDLYTVQTRYWPWFQAFALGDVNGDGRNDVVTVDPVGDGFLNIFLQNSQGKLDRATLVLATGASPFGVQIEDITGDGLNDIIYDYSGGIKVLPQQNDHTFGPSHHYSYPTRTSGGSTVHQALSVGDVTGDRKLDAVVTWSDQGLFVFPYSAQLVAR